MQQNVCARTQSQHTEPKQRDMLYHYSPPVEDVACTLLVTTLSCVGGAGGVVSLMEDLLSSADLRRGGGESEREVTRTGAEIT